MKKSRFMADGIKITEEKKKVCWKNNKIKKSEKEYLEEKTGYKTQGKYCETKGVFCKWN